MDTYNGWTNKETWLANLWLTNDRGAHSYWMEQAREHGDEYSLVEAMKEEYKEDNPLNDMPPSLWSDLLSHALAGVNWCEIAEQLLEDARED